MQPDHGLNFDFEWIDPAGARGEELRATWASLSIRVNDISVTELHDRRSRSVRTRVFLPLYPLAEWLATNWWFLIAETDRPGDISREFDCRHNLRWSREGFALPSLRLVTLDDHFEVRWNSWEVPDAGVRFLGHGQVLLTGEDVRVAITRFIDAVVTRLQDLGIQKTILQDEWAAVQSATRDEQSFCRASARLGVDPFSMDEILESAIVEAATKILPELVDDFLALTSAGALTEDAARLEAATQRIGSDSDSVDALASLRKHVAEFNGSGSPWERGYRFASQLRARIGGGRWRSHSVDELAGHLGIDQLDHCLVQDIEGLQFLDALTGTNAHDNPKILIEKTRSDSKQFAFCRALFEHLTCPLGQFAAVTRLRTERQQRNRAFAAEFLAPHELLREDLSGSSISEDELEDLANAYGVSVFVVRHQIENHRIANITP